MVHILWPQTPKVPTFAHKLIIFSKPRKGLFNLYVVQNFREVLKTGAQIVKRQYFNNSKPPERQNAVGNSFIQAISIAPFKVVIIQKRSGRTTRSFQEKRYRQLRVKDLPKVPTRRLERDLNPRPSGRNVSTIPMRHHVSQIFEVF